MVNHCSVIMPTYRQTQRLSETLISVKRQVLACPHEVIVVDNNDQPDISREVREIVSAEEGVYLRQSKKGSAAARNLGVTYSKGNILVFVDDDVQMDQGFLQAHMDHHTLSKDIVVVGRVDEVSEGPKWLCSYLCDQHVLNQPIERQEELSSHLFYGANSSVRKEWVERVGGFDERFIRRQDGELGYRLKKAGLKFVAEPRARVKHFSKFTPEGYLRRSRANGYYLAMLWEKHPELREEDNPGQYKGLKYALARTFGVSVYGLGRMIYPLVPQILYKGFTARILVENAKGIRDFEEGRAL